MSEATNTGLGWDYGILSGSDSPIYGQNPGSATWSNTSGYVPTSPQVSSTVWTNPNPPTAQTSNNQSSNQGVGAFPQDQYVGWDPVAAQADWEAKGGQTSGGGGGDGGGGGQTIDQQIEAMFGPGYTYLDQLAADLAAAQGENIAGVEDKAETWSGQITTEQGEMEDAIAEQARQLAEVTRSAYADATRSYNNLIQQGLSRFGAGSSAGPALQELVNQEFLRSRGKLGQQEIAGQQQIGADQTKLMNYISKKQDDLRLWKEEAIRTINQNFQSALTDIQGKKFELEKDKTAAKLQILQNAYDQAQSVKNNEAEFRMQLAEFAVEQAQQVANRAFTAQEIAAIVQPILESNISAFNNAFTSGGSNAQGTTALTSWNPYANATEYDEQGNIVLK